MPIKHWDYIRTVHAISRTGSYRGAAEELGITSTTVSRHIEALEEEVGELIFVMKDRKWEPTKVGFRLSKLASSFDVDLGIALKNFDPVEGQFAPLSVSAISYINAHFLAPNLYKWKAAFPDCLLTLDASDDNKAVEEGTLDAAIRLGRPDQIGLSRLKIAESPVGLFAPLGDISVEWIGLPEFLDGLPEMQMARSFFCREPSFRLDSYLAISNASLATGLACILPTCLARNNKRLQQISTARSSQIISREVWFLFHEKRRVDPSIKALKKWVMEVFPTSGKCLCGRCLL